MYESEQYMKFHISTNKYMKGIRCVLKGCFYYNYRHYIITGHAKERG